MAINSIGVNAQSYGIKQPAFTDYTNVQRETQPNFNDGFVHNDLNTSPTTMPKAQVTFNATPSQLASQAFQSTLASLSAAGIPVTVVVVAESSQHATPAQNQTNQGFAQPDNSGFNISQPYQTPPRHQTPMYGSD